MDRDESEGGKTWMEWKVALLFIDSMKISRVNLVKEFIEKRFQCLILCQLGMRSTSKSMSSTNSINFHLSSFSKDGVFLERGGGVKDSGFSALRLESKAIDLIFQIILEASILTVMLTVRVDCVVCMFQADHHHLKRNFPVPRLLQ